MNPYVNLSIKHFLILSAIILVISTALLIKIVLDKKTEFSKNTYKNPLFIFAVFFIVFSISNIAMSIFALKTAINHGANAETNIMALSVAEIKYKNKKSPVAYTEYPDDPKNTINIIYKYGCSDCEKIYQDLIAEIDKNFDRSNILFVPSYTDYAKYLIANTDMYEIPSIVYVSPTEINPDTGKFIMAKLFYLENRWPKLDKLALNNTLSYYRKDYKK